MPRIRGFNGGATGDAAVPTERGPISTWSWFSMPHTDCGAKYCNQFKGDVSGFAGCTGFTLCCLV